MTSLSNGILRAESSQSGVTTGVITASLRGKIFETRFLFCQPQAELSFMVSGVARAALLDGNPYIRETRLLEDSMGGAQTCDLKKTS